VLVPVENLMDSYSFISSPEYIWMKGSETVIKGRFWHVSARSENGSNSVCFDEVQVIWSNADDWPVFLVEIQHNLWHITCVEMVDFQEVGYTAEKRTRKPSQRMETSLIHDVADGKDKKDSDEQKRPCRPDQLHV